MECHSQLHYFLIFETGSFPKAGVYEFSLTGWLANPRNAPVSTSPWLGYQVYPTTPVSPPGNLNPRPHA